MYVRRPFDRSTSSVNVEADHSINPRRPCDVEVCSYVIISSADSDNYDLAMRYQISRTEYIHMDIIPKSEVIKFTSVILLSHLALFYI